MVESDLLAFIKTHSSITDLVSEYYFQFAPKKATPPYLVISRVSTLRERTLRTVDIHPQPLMQIEIIAANYPQAKDIAGKLQTALDVQTSGDMKSITLNNELDQYDPETEYPRVIQDYRITYLNT